MEVIGNPNPFIRPVEDYVRDLEIIDAYLNDTALYLSAQTGDSLKPAWSL